MKPPGPFRARPAVAPPAIDGTGASMIFGHNQEFQKVLMEITAPDVFEVPVRFFFSPEEAEGVATQLRYRAEAARGHKPT